MRQPIKSYKGKKNKKPLWKVFVVAGILAGTVALIATFFAGGLRLLVTLLALFCFFLAFCGALFAPWQRRGLRRLANILKVVTLVAVLTLAVSFIAVEIKIHGYGDGSAGPDAACVIVLGAGLFGERPSQVLASRLDLAYEYLHQNPGSVAIVSGGQGPGESIPEALAMERYLIARGIEAERIIQEDKSSSTLENLINSKAIMEELELPLDSVVIVSNSFHLYRAETLARQQGLEPETLGAPVPKIWLTPLNSYVREYFSIVRMFLRNLFF